jgi:hypothetical protein
MLAQRRTPSRREDPAPQENEPHQSGDHVRQDQDAELQRLAGVGGQHAEREQGTAREGHADAEHEKALELRPDRPVAARHTEGETPVRGGVSERCDQPGDHIGTLRAH